MKNTPGYNWAHVVEHAPRFASESGFSFGLAQTCNPLALFPLPSFLEQFQALKTFEHVAFPAQGSRRA